MTFTYSEAYALTTMRRLCKCVRNVHAHFKNASIYQAYCISVRAYFDEKTPVNLRMSQPKRVARLSDVNVLIF